MNILISNDDGVFAPGILAAKQAVEDIADVEDGEVKAVHLGADGILDSHLDAENP